MPGMDALSSLQGDHHATIMMTARIKTPNKSFPKPLKDNKNVHS